MVNTRRSRQNPAIREYILRNVEEYPRSIAAHTAEKFKLSRTSANRYLVRLLEEGLISADGKTSGRKYSLKSLSNKSFKFRVTYGMPEDRVWQFRIEPLLKDLPSNIRAVCRYGFTEMLNNVIDHSVSDECFINLNRDYTEVRLYIRDYGVGIFEKIKRDFGLIDSRSALLELSKGKLTSDKKRHSGEGIFFTSRMFNKFHIISGNLAYQRSLQDEDEWLIETENKESSTRGTLIYLCISTDADWTTESVFKKYFGDTVGFRRTHVPVLLGLYDDDELVSRSQAKRVLARFEDFSEVMLDFKGVPNIGQPFADEIFRVFTNEHPDISVIAINAEPPVQNVIDHVIASGWQQDSEPEFPF